MADIASHTYIIYDPPLQRHVHVHHHIRKHPSLSPSLLFLETVKKHGLTHFYLSPPRLRKYHVKDFDPTTFYVLESVGEPLNSEAWNRYNDGVPSSTPSGKPKPAPIVTRFPSAIETKPGSATGPFFGIELGLSRRSWRLSTTTMLRGSSPILN